MLANLGVTDGDNQKYFAAALTAAIALIVLAYLIIYPDVPRPAPRQPGLERPFRVPGGDAGAMVATVLATGWSLLTAIVLAVARIRHRRSRPSPARGVRR